MAQLPPIDQPVRLVFEMVDPEGTAPMRVVAGHVKRVSEGWAELSTSLFDLADSIDRMVAGPSDSGDPS